MKPKMLIAMFWLLPSFCFALDSEDAYVRTEGSKWVLGTRSVERTLVFKDGMLNTESFRNKLDGHELAHTSSPTAMPWKFISSKTTKLHQGELQLDIVLKSDSLAVTKTYVVYPGSSIVREWTTFRNVGSAPISVSDPEFLDLDIQLADSQFLDFHWITGGENQLGSWVLKTEQLSAGKPRLFDSADPYPTTDACAEVVNNEINVKIFVGDHQVWPTPNWRYIPSAAGVPVPFSTDIEVSQGDRLQFRTETNANVTFDLAAFDPTIVYEDGETHTASKEFSDEQGRNGWSYQAFKNGTYVDLQYDAATRKWLYDREHVGAPFIGPDNQQAGSVPVARIWTVPKAGRIRVTGMICNGGRPSYAKVGSSSYAPWVAFADRRTQDGIFIGWDYFGHWASSYAVADDGGVSAKLHVAGFRRKLMPGESIVTPKAFVGLFLFRGDLDNAGNELLDWQYRYLWDYTRAAWFPGIRMLGYWYKGVLAPQQDYPGMAGNSDFSSFFPKVFRTVDLMRYVGGDAYDRELGWWDRAGDWNGPDFREAGRYLRKHQMGQLIYITPYMVDPKSNVAREHPDWVLNYRVGEPPKLYGGTLDLSRPEVVNFVSDQLDEFVKRWGDFELRDDFYFTSPGKDGDETPLLGQDQGFREFLQSFLDKHPASAFDGVNNGGNYISYDYARYASAINFSDGAVGILRNYWESLLFPPDKSSDQPGQYNPDKYDKALSRGWLSINFEMTGDTWNPAKLEGLRELIDIYHYLQSKGVVGRWVHVYRPLVTGDDPTLYLERLSRDGLRGIIIPKRPAPHAVTIKPKGLLPNQKYNVSYQESGMVQEREGADLMDKGIELEHMPEGELIYLNLPLHPGSKLDTAPPKPPSQVTKRRGENLTYPGIELQWKAGTDDNWISYYEILRDGAVIDKVSKGTFYFDHSAGADLAAAYEIRTLDGAGNVSATALAQGLAAKRSHIVDDAPGAGITFSPEWKHTSGTPLVAYQGTLTSADRRGATAEMTFEGRRVLWFAELGPDNGTTAVSIDGGSAEIVDTYAADDVWGVAVYRKDFGTVGRHSLHIEVLGEHKAHPNDQSGGTFVNVDGIRVEME